MSKREMETINRIIKKIKYNEKELSESIGERCYIRDDLIFGDKSSDDVWIKEIDDENCYIVAYGGCDSRCMGGWIFDYRDKYKEEDNG